MAIEGRRDRRVFCSRCGSPGALDGPYCVSCQQELAILEARSPAGPGLLGRRSPADSLDDGATHALEARSASGRFQLGERLADRWRVDAFIGRGGMGEVYRVFDDVAQRVRALKVIHAGLTRSADARSRFLEEAALSQELMHERIVRTFEIGSSGDAHFFTMELVAGGSLRELNERARASGRCLPIERVVAIVIQILDALRYAHRFTIHRDIKPENVLLTADGDVKLADFGLAKLVDPTRRAQMSQAMGTPYYMAPEQMRSGEVVDRRADLFAVGVLLWEILTGEDPAGSLDPPSELRSCIPPTLDAIVKRAIARRADDRFPDASTMLDAMTVVEREVAAEREERQRRALRVAELIRRASELRDAEAWASAIGLLNEASSIAEDPEAVRAVIDETNEAWRAAEEARRERDRRAREIRDGLSRARVLRNRGQLDEARRLLDDLSVPGDVPEPVRLLRAEIDGELERDRQDREAREERAARAQGALREAEERRGRGDLAGARTVLAEVMPLAEDKSPFRRALAAIEREEAVSRQAGAEPESTAGDKAPPPPALPEPEELAAATRQTPAGESIETAVPVPATMEAPSNARWNVVREISRLPEGDGSSSDSWSTWHEFGLPMDARHLDVPIWQVGVRVLVARLLGGTIVALAFRGTLDPWLNALANLGLGLERWGMALTLAALVGAAVGVVEAVALGPVLMARVRIVVLMSLVGVAVVVAEKVAAPKLVDRYLQRRASALLVDLSLLPWLAGLASALWLHPRLGWVRVRLAVSHVVVAVLIFAGLLAARDSMATMTFAVLSSAGIPVAAALAVMGVMPGRKLSLTPMRHRSSRARR